MRRRYNDLESEQQLTSEVKRSLQLKLFLSATTTLIGFRPPIDFLQATILVNHLFHTFA
jgi:hypothetical protein